MDLQKYAERRAPIEERFLAKPPVPGTEQTHLSPSRRFSLHTAVHDATPASWAYSRGVVRHVASQRIIADVHRNLGHFWHAWVSRADGEYLLCGEDYQGYNVIDLEREQNILTFPDEAYEGTGFCWAAVFPSPCGQLLAVDGCYWACPYELVIYDFSEPLRSPLPELARIEDLGDTQGWREDGSFAYRLDDGREAVWRADHSAA